MLFKRAGRKSKATNRNVNGEISKTHKVIVLERI